jgi:hypothetical protein
MKFFKLFVKHSDYEEYAENFNPKPMVAWCIDQRDTHYKPVINNILLYKATAKLPETTAATTTNAAGIHIKALSGTSGQLTITSHTFENGLGTITFNGDLIRIGQRAFQGCTGLTSIEIPKKVSTVGDYAFSSCTNMTSTVFIDGSQLSTIGTGSFMAVVNLRIYPCQTKLRALQHKHLGTVQTLRQ